MTQHRPVSRPHPRTTVTVRTQTAPLPVLWAPAVWTMALVSLWLSAPWLSAPWLAGFVD